MILVFLNCGGQANIVQLFRLVSIHEIYSFTGETMDLNAALILVRIVDKGSFTAAAQELGMTKATVSRRIAELEQRLGARLLYRSTRQLTLTEAGEQYYLRCSKAVEELAQAELMLSASQQEVTGILKLAVPIETGQLVVGRLVANFLQAYPGMKVELELTNRIVDPISEGWMPSCGSAT